MREGVPADPTVHSELTLKDGQATGLGGVNSFSCSYQASDDGKISFGELTVTQLAGSTAATEQEAKFLEALKRASQFEIYQGDLVLSEMTLFGSNGLVVLAPLSATPAAPSSAAASGTG